MGTRRVGHDLPREKPALDRLHRCRTRFFGRRSCSRAREGSRGRLPQNDSDPSVQCFSGSGIKALRALWHNCAAALTLLSAAGTCLLPAKFRMTVRRAPRLLIALLLLAACETFTPGAEPPRSGPEPDRWGQALFARFGYTPEQVRAAIGEPTRRTVEG